VPVDIYDFKSLLPGEKQFYFLTRSDEHEEWGVSSSIIQVSETLPAKHPVIDAICDLPWQSLRDDEILMVAAAYRYFSIQFRENLETALAFWPDDAGLVRLYEEECNTDNLSPWPGVAAEDERLNHDEFIRRLLALEPIDAPQVEAAGAAYLARVRALDPLTRAQSIVSYEDGGLSRVFQAVLRAPAWNGISAQAFKFFLEQHIQFDKNETAGHGMMVRHLQANCDVTPLWTAFLEILTASVPRAFGSPRRTPTAEAEPRELRADDFYPTGNWTAAVA